MTLWMLIALVAAAVLLSGGIVGFRTIIMLLFWGAVIWLVISLINAGTKNPEAAIESAPDILNKRYAKGEMTREQYLYMKEELAR